MESFLLVFQFLLQILLCGFLCSISSVKDTITATDFLIDGKTITSSDGSFEMGFFSPGSFMNNWYVGIWYKHDVPDKSVVWVANRAIPLNNTSGVVLKIIDPGRLALVTADNRITWSTNKSRPLAVKNPIAQLLNSGNLIVRDANDTEPENFLWQSFDYPTDTLLPGMKLGKNFVTRQEFYLSSWKNEYDPAPGDYTFHCDPTGYPQDVMRKGKVKVFSSGPWNGLRWSGVPGLTKNPVYTFTLDFDEKKAFYSYALLDSSVISKLTLNSKGMLQRWTWDEKRQEWHVYLASPADTCDNYGTCGAYGSCNIILSPVCSCLDKFVPKNSRNWAETSWSGGCVRRTSLNCQNGDGFLRYSGIKLPDTQYSWFDVSMTLQECKQACLKNCSCVAYSNLDIRNGGSGCLLWYGDLIDIRELPGGQDIYIRMAASELGSKKKTKLLVLSLSLVIGVAVVGLTIGLYTWTKKNKRKLNLKDDLDLPLFTLSTITKATSNFSAENKLGEGGFGSVYKGILEGGQEIAIKRLAKSSSQGVNEFKNEVICIAKLQHRNLVNLIGCCVGGEEKMLVYEYMPNRSLDFFIFDEKKSTILDWPKRFNIINGIARGLLYLHQDSRLRIIHRDLKASNILLDTDMNPKISDFGIARTVIGNETSANTHHVVGTHGYMSPEYVVDGVFSIKSDVFSFGVLVLEIISGKRNRGFSHGSRNINLLGHVRPAWRLYKEGRTLELIDVHLTDSCYFSELLRLIHVALLCVQQRPENRPDMSTVVVMLANDAVLPQAKEPGFFTGSKFTDSDYSSTKYTTNEVTFTQLDPR
ncbi:G-type lectin S-receptor-like serine/threonine-protein kinase At4g27290 isoform X1 [Nicotiana tabacum]|uniref:Receptor-like serine/threonine-protein kinase n=1 Tax=Nicotiana tabacum TaxID=4097 RepID=A0A1S4DEL0_TOBAC|nr:G-type lectin S-receptor-like serine/threonine-protein kinase At4g27290 isoform X1 [Nicotiana tomentosiformis]XP_009607318.1 G-type lectin S-receptor-like serine/threonine-protein kinase At4g27290 isoform X1 [Nicotiana tomentosiformis]XP_016511899.1 PREDICTED: G-type lectin S-receptor-like serine/threonine-protein kinase At4g27290 isoform X1 [Nicotiana tabacum]XP_016511900.1 PREDICTED: G-type lectin S-receptor-like serine/threonine-protein kinase At4g27290 isoform X1 [Nicotiana tabacum]